MVRPHFGPPRFKPRPYTDGHSSAPCDEHYTPNSKRRRDDYPGKAPFPFRESRGRGRPPFGKRPPLMGERREPAFNHWRSQNQETFKPYPSQMEQHHSQRRPPASRPTRPPQAQNHSSSRSPVQGSPGHRGPPFHGHPSSQSSPSPRHYRNHPADRRPGATPPYQGSFRGPKRQTDFPHQEQRSRDPRGHYGPRERPYEQHPGGKRWNGPGAFSHQHNGEHGPSGSQRKPRELHGRGSCPERWSSEQDSRRKRGEVEREREGSRSHSTEKAQDGHSHLPPYRSPSWKGGPSSASSSSYHNSPQQARPPQRQVAVSRKRRMPDPDMPPAGPAQEYSHHPKYPRRERPQLLNVPRGFGGRPLSLMDRSRIVKGRQMRAESVLRLRGGPPPPPLRPKPPPMAEAAARGNISSILAIRKKRFQSNTGPLKQVEPGRPKARQTSPSANGNASKSSRDSDTAKEQVESRRSLSTHSSSPVEKDLSCDLVVVSHWQARDRSPKSKTERSSDSSAPPNNRFTKIHDSRSSLNDRRGAHLDRRPFRPFHLIQQESHRAGRPFRRPGPGPGPSQRPQFVGGPRRMAPELSGNIRRPLMESFVPRPFPHQKPMFRKTQNIMSKYRNMQTMRRVPYNRGPNQQRW